jgi:hypothetical protein
VASSSAAGLWRLERFDECVERWLDLDDPPSSVRFAVYNWLISRSEDPYQDAKREPGFQNLWSAQVPGSTYGHLGVLCAYWIFEIDHRVACESVTSLSEPM